MEKSINGELNKSEWRQYLINCLKFTAPGLAVFFSQLALGIDWRASALTASFVLYANISDFLTKLNQGKK